MDPSTLPAGRGHLEREDRVRLVRFELLADQGRFAEAQDVVEELWLEAYDAHRPLYQGLANAMTAAAARSVGKRRGAAAIARRTREMLVSFPRVVLDLDLDALLDSLDQLVRRGDGPLRLRRQG